MTETILKSMRLDHPPVRKLTAKALSEICASLTDIDWRLLHWLLHYPLQRADDLVVGVARWASRATVYRHVHALETHGLIESVLPKTPGTGKRLYHLSNPGLHLLAVHLNTPARELSHMWQADEAGLMRLLPRLQTLLVLQEVINGLVTYAADAMTIQGRRPHVVRWTWQRDVTHHFLYRDRSMRFFADGILAFLIRTQQSGGNVQDQWFGVVLLSTMLDDERLMRLRLERLMCWRESPERWSCYQHMLPVLILAKSERQREHWQRAIGASALKLHLDPLAGAMICLPPSQSTHVNPWLFNWRSLATDVPCHPQEILKVVPHSAFPSSLSLEESEEELDDAHSSSIASACARSTKASARLSHLIVGSLDNRTAQDPLDGREEREVVSLLALRLTSCQWSVLHLLLAHPLLSDEELAAFLGLQRKSARCSLYELHRLGCLEPVVTSAGKRWRLCERALRLVAAADHLHIRTIAVVPDNETDMQTPPIKQRGEAWFLQHIQHTAGIYGFFVSLTLAASMGAGHELCWWETGAMCERRYRIGEQWFNVRPDAEASYRVGHDQQVHVRFWLEWDRGTMNARDLAVKFSSYGHCIASRQWARESLNMPTLLCIAPDIAQERRMQRVAQDRLAHTPGLVLRTTTEALLREQGLRAPIWLQVMPHAFQASPRLGPRRLCLFDAGFGSNKPS